MKVIINQDVQNLGEEGDVKNVAKGYATNFLFPKKYAVPYTKQNLKLLDLKRASIEKRKDDKKRSALDLKERLETEEIIFKMPAGESGKLFGSVNNALVAEELDKRGYSIEKKKISIPEHSIRMIGTFQVNVKLYGQQEAIVKLIVEKIDN